MKNKVDGTTWNDYLIGAMRAYRLNDLDLAEKRLDKAFAVGGPSIPFLHLLAGHIAHARNAVIEAEKSWRRVLELDEDNAEAWNNLGVLYRRKGDMQKALDAFLEARQRAPDRPDIPFNIGNLHKAAGRIDEAVTAYNQSIEIDPGYAPAYNNLGTIYESRRQRDKAMEVFRRGLSADTGDASIRFNMGLVYQEQERWDEAREAFDTALKNRPGWVPGLNNLGIVLQEAGREDEAARTFRTLLDIEPDNISALNNLGVAYARLGRTDDARACFRKALETEPDYIKAALNLHDSFHEGRELNEALEELNKQITHHPTDPEIRVRMARTLMGLTRWDEAELSLDHVLERDPDNNKALRAKAELYLATKKPEEAEALLKRLPHDAEAVRDLARLYASTGRSGNAEKLLGELIAIDPDDAESRRILADLIAEKRPQDAAKLREEASEADPGKSSDMISLAELYGRTGRKDLALGKLDDAVSHLGRRGEAEDLDQMSSVLSLYEKAAEALEDEHGSLFAERTAQLGRKLQSAIGRPGAEWSRSGQFAMEEIPLDEDDALSLLDINAMEPIIRINEEEETVFLEESTEDLEDAWTELQRREEDPDYPKGWSSPDSSGSSGQTAGQGMSSPSASGGQQGGGPPVHIHLPPQSSAPVPPQVIYQDIRPVTQAPPQSPPDMPSRIPDESTELSIEDIEEELLPVLDEETEEEIVLDEVSIEETEESPEEEGLAEEVAVEESEEILEDDDAPFYVPESDALSEDLPDSEETPRIEPDLVFTDEDLPEDGASGDNSALILEEPKDEMVLSEDFGGVESQILPDAPAPAGTETEEEEPSESMDPAKMAEMFKYLSDLTDETTGEGRRRLIEDGVPLKLAGLHARLSGEPRFRDVAQKYDRRSRERHNIELNEEKIRGSLDAFKSLAEAYPKGTVSESLTQKLGKIMSFVGKLKSGEQDDA